MTSVPKRKITVDEYLAWAEGRPGRYELYAGEVYQTAPQRAEHARLKFAVQTELANGIRRAALDCQMLPDGMTVRIDAHTADEPDALVYCGERIPNDDLEVPHPVIVVEVLSPSTRHVDASLKLAGYFTRPSLRHYLLIDPTGRLVIHHARGRDAKIATLVLHSGPVYLDPPGMEISVEQIFETGGRPL
jgi:Uma2 family endonuclease